MEKEVLFSVENGVGLITLNRPERRNSINQNLLKYLFEALEEVSENKEIKAAVITGNGKSFCSGVDLAIAGKENLSDPRGDGKYFTDIFGQCRKPVIGAVNGHAITGGFEGLSDGRIAIRLHMRAVLFSLHPRRMLPGENGETRRHAARIGHIGLRELRAARGEAVHVRRFVECGAVAAQIA